MKRIAFFILTLFVFQISFSQTEKLLIGKVSDKYSPIQGADVINYTTQKNTVTNSEGVFYIEAKPNDVLLFYHKNYYERKTILGEKDIALDSLKIELVLKSIELNEVVIYKRSNEFKFTKAEIDEWKLLVPNELPKVVGVYDGSITNGVNLMAVGAMVVWGVTKVIKMIYNPKIVFKEYVASHISKDFLIKELKLQPNEIPLFLDFCDDDPKLNSILAEPNALSVKNFLKAKNIQFKKN